MSFQAGKILVVGAGTGGIRAALDLAQAGVRVILAESSDHTGGLVSQLDAQFPTTSCGFCRMLPMTDRDKGSQHCLRRGLSHDNIDLRLGCSLVSLDGEAGAFTASLDQALPLVDREKCMGCSLCETVCPVEIPDPYNQGLSFRKAVGRPCPQALPNAYAIDPEACTLCGECQKICPTGAITLTPGGKGAYRILVVDDEAIVRDSMKEWLGLEGYGTATAASGAEALELLAEETFHLMLTDIKMPGMDGVALLTRAREENPDLTVIMMTAYAEVDSAVAAMKEGALDYVIKPFEPEKVLSMVAGQYGLFCEQNAVREEVDALILATGTGFYLPDQDKEIYGYNLSPRVVTALEFERMLSAAGPGLPENIRRIAWLQCVGSRDREHGFCSSACCMISVKQSVMARERLPGLSNADIFYMDLRTPGKRFDAYREDAAEAGTGFIRARVHSISPDKGENLSLRYADPEGRICTCDYDLVVLATGQAVTPETGRLIASLDLETDDWGFVRPPAFNPHFTSRPGIFTTGGLTGFKDIETTVTLGSAAALSALEIAAEKAQGLPEADAGTGDPEAEGDLSGERPQIGLLLCDCSRLPGWDLDRERIVESLGRDPDIVAVSMTTDLCLADGWKQGLKQAAAFGANRLVIGGCRACLSREKKGEMGRAAGVPGRLIRGVDLLTLAGTAPGAPGVPAGEKGFIPGAGLMPRVFRELGRAVAELKTMDPHPPEPEESFARALVLGGGMAGMTAALAIAGAGFGVDLVEETAALGGHLSWIGKTAEGGDSRELMAGLTEAVTGRGNIRVHLSARLGQTRGLPGRWATRLEPGGEEVRHGVVVVATGGREAASQETGPGIFTQKGFQEYLDRGGEAVPKTLAMILCRNCREKDKNYCSRVCCPRALIQSMAVLEKNPDARIFVLYRDMMTPGSLEALYTRAREAGIIFIPYEVSQPPGIEPGPETNPENSMGDGPETGCRITCRDPVLGRDLCIEADTVVLATGVAPVLPSDLTASFPAEKDEFGFFKAADPKWRPMEALNPRILACGLALKPCDLELAGATARAAAMRAVGLLSSVSRGAESPGASGEGASGRAVSGATARVKTALCSLCMACIEACPFEARHLDTEQGVIVVDSLACQGCGLCAAVCPSKAARVEGLTHYLDLIDHALADICLPQTKKEVQS